MNEARRRAERSAGEAPPVRPRRRLRFAAAIVVVASAAAAAFGASPESRQALASARAVPTLAGTWQPLPAAPIVPSDTRLVSVWTGREMVLFDRVPASLPDVASMNAAAAYDPTAGSWRALTPPPGPGGNYEGSFVGAWTGKEVLVGGPGANLAYNPTTNRWRQLSVGLGGPMSVWTGREMISWGGGCCGDASAEGLAYNPATNRSRKLPRSPLAAAQRPIGVWTGREVIILVSGLDPDGTPYPARLARAAAYNPRTNTWRRIARLPAVWRPTTRAAAVWDGRRLLVVGAGKRGKATLAYNPATNRWRTRAAMPFRLAGPAVWTGKRVMLWRGRDGLAYNSPANRWTALPQWPFQGHANATMVWTGRALIVWGFTSSPFPQPADGAAFMPTIP
jgi:hypothetical protein